MVTIVGVVPNPPSSGTTVCLLFTGAGAGATVTISFDGGPPVTLTATLGANGVSQVCFGWLPGARGADVVISTGNEVTRTYLAAL